MYVAVAGAGRASPEVAGLAERVGQLLAKAGAVVVTGGLGGVMEAASRGASRAGGQVLAIVPGESRREATAYATLAVATGTGQARNLAIAATCDGLIAVGGEWGTLSEIGLARKLGRPVVALAGWDIRGIERCSAPEDAVRRILELVGAHRPDGTV
ncbi:MAG: TIGR00725 family protein [Gaiellales bacterium]